MDQAGLVEEIITTKNTLTILRRAFNANQASLQPFSPIFQLINQLIEILTHSSTTQIEDAVREKGSTTVFQELKSILNELSDGITTRNTSQINPLSERLRLCVEQLRPSSANTSNGQDTADAIFKKQLSNAHAKETTKQKKAPITRAEENQAENEYSQEVDPFRHFRFARRRRISTSSDDDMDDLDTKSDIQCVPSGAPIVQAPIKAKPQLMISYNHASKPLCLDIYNRLTTDGYKVWIDLKEMHGSTLVAMAKAIEDANIVIYCITEKYSQSPNCQKEAEYAFVQQKTMIPLLMQSKYKPTGWLGLLLGAAFYIDFTKNDFEENYAKLKNEIQSNGTNSTPILPPDTSAEERPVQPTKTKPKTSKEGSSTCVLF